MNERNARIPDESRGRRRYRFLENLGHGSMGAVWLAYDTVERCRVAIKEASGSSPMALLRLKREFRTLAALQHRNVVRVRDLWVDGAGAFLTMDFVAGHDLRSVLRGDAGSSLGLQPVPSARDVAVQVLGALEYLHGNGLVHRDLKPGNLMVGGDGRMTLIDFGLVAALDERRFASFDRRPSGTPPYVAPEQARGGRPEPGSDLYALGVVLSELSGGSPPGLDAPVRALCAALLRDDVRRRPDASSALALVEPASVAGRRRTRSGLTRAAVAPPAGCDETMEWLADRVGRPGDGLFVGSVVEGPARAGKSAVLDWVEVCARSLGGLVLRGGGRADEHLSHNVLDAAIDSLAGVLLETSFDASLACDLALAASAFPVLGGAPAGSPVAPRACAFDALIRILGCLAGAEGLYLLVDDLQWADDASLAFLDRLLARKPAGVGLIATLAIDLATPRLLSWLDARPELARRGLARRPASPPASARGARAEAAPQPRRTSLAS